MSPNPLRICRKTNTCDLILKSVFVVQYTKITSNSCLCNKFKFKRTEKKINYNNAKRTVFAHFSNVWRKFLVHTLNTLLFMWGKREKKQKVTRKKTNTWLTYKMYMLANKIFNNFRLYFCPPRPLWSASVLFFLLYINCWIYSYCNAVGK